MIQALSPTVAQEQGYTKDTWYRLYEQISLIHIINKWIARNIDDLFERAKGVDKDIPWLTNTDLSEFSQEDIDAALEWFRKNGWWVVSGKPHPGSAPHLVIYVFKVRTVSRNYAAVYNENGILRGGCPKERWGITTAPDREKWYVLGMFTKNIQNEGKN